MNRKTWVIESGLGEIDLGMSHSLMYVHEGFLRFGFEFPLSGDDMTHALAGGVR